jgi:hypothetical protein
MQLIKVGGREFPTLFDTEVRNSYVVRSVAELLAVSRVSPPLRTALGGQIGASALLEAEIEGHLIFTHAFVVDRIGDDEHGRPIEILFGTLAMKQWGIRLVAGQRALDLSHYSEQFVEF